MKQLIVFFFILIQVTVFSQQKGVTHTQNEKQNGERGNTYAVVVGISDYQDKEIPDLKFANRDAEAFANWLKSAAGGNIKADNIQLLTNNQATNAAIYLALNWLMEESKEGDQVIIYFSGHGDVETKTIRQNGFLLGHDTPAAVYMAGAVSLGYLQDVVSTLSQKNKSKVLVITDACHSGKLVGSSIQGTQLTNANLAKQFAGETKILSCQPNEFSIEGIQWGGGRGAFSYHLLDGLTGLADGNKDGFVTLNEIDRYLGDKVPAETSPLSQTPFTVGDRNSIIANVDSKSIVSLLESKSSTLLLAQVNSKGLEEEVLAKVDATTRQQYNDFKNAMSIGNLTEPLDSSAWYYYQKLSANQQIQTLNSLMKRNLAIALLDKVQQALNALLANDAEQANQWIWNPEKYKQYGDFIEKALELLGKEHPLYKSTLSKKLYFEAQILVKSIADYQESMDIVDSLRKEAKLKIINAIYLEPNAAYLYYWIGSFYTSASISRNNQYNSDSVEIWCSKAIELAPGWLLPYLEIAQEFISVQMDEIKGIQWLDKATLIDSNNLIILRNKISASIFYNHLDEAEKICKKYIRLQPDSYYGYSGLGISLMNSQEYKRAEMAFLRTIEKNPPSLASAYTKIGNLYSLSRQFHKAEKHNLKALQGPKIKFYERTELLLSLMMNAEISMDYKSALYWVDSVLNQTIDHYYIIQALTTKAKILFQNGNYFESESLINKALTLDPTPNPFFIIGKAYLGLIAEKRNEFVKAEDFFKQAEAYGYLPDCWRQGALFHYGAFLMRQNRIEEAKNKWEQIIKEFPRDYNGYYGLALYYASKNEQKLALDNLEKAIIFWYPVPKPIMEEPLFKKIRKTKRFKEMMKKNFKEEIIEDNEK